MRKTTHHLLSRDSKRTKRKLFNVSPMHMWKARDIVLHAMAILIVLALVIGVPFVRSDTFAQLLSGNTDALSSATVALASPSGEFIVLINSKLHPNADNLETWEAFFAGEEIGYLFEDIDVVVPEGDTTGLTMAQSYQSRLPENQLTIRLEPAITLFSKAEYGRFDIIVMSAEMADAYDAASLYDNEGIIMIVATDSGAIV